MKAKDEKNSTYENAGAVNEKNGIMTEEALEKVSGGAVGADTEEGRLLWEDLLREIHTELNRVEYETDPIPDRQRELYRNAIKAYEACIIALRARGICSTPGWTCILPPASSASMPPSMP